GAVLKVATISLSRLRMVSNLDSAWFACAATVAGTSAATLQPASNDTTPQSRVNEIFMNVSSKRLVVFRKSEEILLVFGFSPVASPPAMRVIDRIRESDRP